MPPQIKTGESQWQSNALSQSSSPTPSKRGLAAEILSRIHAAKFQIVAIKSLRLTKGEAEGFYAVHRERPFFGELTDFMSSGKAFVMVLEAEGAIAKWRETMGATDPAKAAPGTIRSELGTSIQYNCTHGSDAPETAAFEIGYFFSGTRTGLKLRAAPGKSASFCRADFGPSSLYFRFRQRDSSRAFRIALE